MEIRFICESPFVTAARAGLKSIGPKCSSETDDDFPQTETFLGPRAENYGETHPAAIKGHTYGSSLK